MTKPGDRGFSQQGEPAHDAALGWRVRSTVDSPLHHAIDTRSPARHTRLVDDLLYCSKYHDVWNAHVDADAHYNSFGWHENRDSDAFFSTSTYLSANTDVNAAGVDPLDHWHTIGWTEGRVPSIRFDPAQ